MQTRQVLLSPVMKAVTLARVRLLRLLQVTFMPAMAQVKFWRAVLMEQTPHLQVPLQAASQEMRVRQLL